jgi:hypothetical protein
MEWYIRLGALVLTAILIVPFVLKTLKLKEVEDVEEEDRE